METKQSIKVGSTGTINGRMVRVVRIDGRSFNSLELTIQFSDNGLFDCAYSDEISWLS